MGFDSMRHRHAGIVLVERKSRDSRNRAFWDKLPNEDHASLRSPLHIEAKVFLRERPMKQRRDSQYPRPVELEANQTEVRSSFEFIQLRARRNETFDQRGVDSVVEHRYVLPLRGQKSGLGTYAAHARHRAT